MYTKANEPISDQHRIKSYTATMQVSILNLIQKEAYIQMVFLVLTLSFFLAGQAEEILINNARD